MRQVAIRHGRVRAHENLNWPSEFTFYARGPFNLCARFRRAFSFRIVQFGRKRILLCCQARASQGSIT